MDDRSRKDALVESVLQGRGLFMRYLGGFDDSNYRRTAENLPNHVAWTLGHCALTMHRAAERIDGISRLDDAFIPGAATGDARRYGTESIAFGSNPRVGEPVYPPYARCVSIFSEATERLADSLRRMEESHLDVAVTLPGGTALPRWMLPARIIFHNGHHCGQIADLRRALGMKPVLS